MVLILENVVDVDRKFLHGPYGNFTAGCPMILKNAINGFFQTFQKIVSSLFFFRIKNPHKKPDVVFGDGGEQYVHAKHNIFSAPLRFHKNPVW